jgi:hypothetical protein
MSNLIYFSGMPLLDNRNKLSDQIPGLTDFLKIQKYFQLNAGVLDRSRTIHNPFRSVISNPLPKFDNKFNRSYVDCVMTRMNELHLIHKNTDKKFRLLYSGGIDSTAILAGFIEYYGLEDTAKILEISCTPDSIDENPWAWNQYIRKGNFKIRSSLDQRYHWADDVITIMGEGNDHLFGGLGTGPWNKFVNDKNLYAEVTRELVVEYLLWSNKESNITDAEYCADIFIKIANIAPFAIDNMYLFMWWVKFVLDWEAIMIRVLAQSNTSIAPIYNLIQFYNTIDFQQWSMHFHQDHPLEFAESTNYKQECKKFILNVLDIPEYAAKCKFTSWPRVHSLIPSGIIIDEELKIYKNPEDFLNFIRSTG